MPRPTGTRVLGAGAYVEWRSVMRFPSSVSDALGQPLLYAVLGSLGGYSVDLRTALVQGAAIGTAGTVAARTSMSALFDRELGMTERYLGVVRGMRTFLLGRVLAVVALAVIASTAAAAVVWASLRYSGIRPDDAASSPSSTAVIVGLAAVVVGAVVLGMTAYAVLTSVRFFPGMLNGVFDTVILTSGGVAGASAVTGLLGPAAGLNPVWYGPHLLTAVDRGSGAVFLSVAGLSLLAVVSYVLLGLAIAARRRRGP